MTKGSTAVSRADSKAKLWIRADGNVEIGLGHIVRSLALAKMVESEFEAEFVSLEMPEKMAETLRNDGIEVRAISTETEFLTIPDKEDVVLLDGYHFTSEYQLELRNRCAALVCIDDLRGREFHADLIINHTPGVSPADYTAQEYTQFALGPEFALLRPEFLGRGKGVRSETPEIAETPAPFVNTARPVGPNTSDSETSYDYFVCFGGSDAQNLSERTYLTLRREVTEARVALVTGSAYEHTKKLEALLHNDPMVDHFQAVSAGEMANLMQRSRIAIVPSSGILLEAFAMDCTVISGYYTGNQRPNYEAYLAMGAIIGAGQFSEDELGTAIRKVKSIVSATLEKQAAQASGSTSGTIKSSRAQSTPRSANNPVDGQSGQRILNLFRKLRKPERDPSLINSQ